MLYARDKEVVALQMLLDKNSHCPWLLAMLAEVDGSWGPQHMEDHRLPIPALQGEGNIS